MLKECTLESFYGSALGCVLGASDIHPRWASFTDMYSPLIPPVIVARVAPPEQSAA